jgi:hypothetical protein
VIGPQFYTQDLLMTEKKASLSLDGIASPIELPIYQGTIGPDVIDVGKLTAEGYFTYDPGFVSTAACESAIKASCSTAATLSNNSPSTATI